MFCTMEDNMDPQESTIQEKSFISDVVITVFEIVLVFVIYKVFIKRRSHFPPGPIGLPIVGYLPFMPKTSFLKFMELGNKYGDVFSLKLGSQTVVVLNGAEPIKEAFAKTEFLGRPAHSAFDILARKSPFFNSGVEVWSEHRRFVLHSMKDLGLGHSKIEGHIQDEIAHFLEVLRSHNGQPTDLQAPLTPSMANNISALVYSERYEYGDAELATLDKNFHETTKVIGLNSWQTFFPWMRHVPFFFKLKDIEKGKRAAEETEHIFRKKVKHHEITLDPNNIRDYMDSYLVEMKLRQENNPNTTLSESMLVNSVVDLFRAGSDTVITAILWCVYIMASHRRVQQRVHEEISAKLGSEKRPEFADMKGMPYTHAVIMEVMRWKTVAPLSARSTLAETTVGRYTIPKGTTVIANRWAAHHDPKHWSDPDSFIPERFLSKDGRSIQKSPNYMPFSFGKRICPGEAMAYMEVFLYFVSILQRFDVAFPEGVTPTFGARLTVTYGPDPYKVCFTPKS